MNTVKDFLVKSGFQYLATTGLDGRPKVRPFQFMVEEKGRLYFCTANTKDVYEQMRKQPYVELCASGENYSWMRLRGKAVFTSDLSIKAKILEAVPLVKSIYKTPDNPVFEAFFLDEAEATIADFSGAPPETFKL